MSGLAIADGALQQKKPHLRALTGVRFVAALHVVLFHVLPWPAWSALPADSPWPASHALVRILRNLVGTGYVAVSLFFVLSGFILSYTYCGKTGGRPFAPSARRDFYIGRVARIYPVYALGLALAAPFYIAGHLRAHDLGTMAVEVAAVLTLVQSYVPSLALAWNPPSWSLSTEASFYVVFPFLAPPLLRVARPTAIVVATAAWLAALLLAVTYLVLQPDGVAAPTIDTVGFWLDVVRYNPLARAPELVVGILLGRLFLDDELRRRFTPWASGVSLVAAAGIVGLLALSDRIPYVLLHAGLLTPLFAALLFALAVGRGPLATLLSLPALTLLGEASYSLYVLHVPLYMIAHKAAEVLLGAASTRGLTFACLFTLFAIAASIVCFRAMEVPLRARVRDALRATRG